MQLPHLQHQLVSKVGAPCACCLACCAALRSSSMLVLAELGALQPQEDVPDSVVACLQSCCSIAETDATAGAQLSIGVLPPPPDASLALACSGATMQALFKACLVLVGVQQQLAEQRRSSGASAAQPTAASQAPASSNPRGWEVLLTQLLRSSIMFANTNTNPVGFACVLQSGKWGSLYWLAASLQCVAALQALHTRPARAACDPHPCKRRAPTLVVREPH
jgi:hypothetical protein